LQVQDIFEKDGDQLALDDPKAFYGDFQILNPTDAQVPTTTTTTTVSQRCSLLFEAFAQNVKFR
jgi:hypothetical protein